MTFATLKNNVTRKTGVLGYDFISLLREAENEFIEKTHCLWKHDKVSTEDLNEGTLSDTYDLPTGFTGYEFIKLEWEGNKIEPVHEKSGVEIYRSSGVLKTGIPAAYQIEGTTYRLIPKPSSHGYMGRWYHYYQTATADSPIIPVVEHRSLAYYVIFTVFEMEKKYDQATIYENRWEKEIQAATKKYNIMKANQKIVEDVLGRTEEEMFYNVDNIEGYFSE